MTILITGATGTVGSQVLAHLAQADVPLRALTRSPETASLAPGIERVAGDLSDIDAIRSALDGASTLFLLAPSAAGELTEAMLALDAAREAGVKGIVYLSVYRGDIYADVPHFAAKTTVERMIDALDLPVTVLRPAYFMQNDVRLKDPLTRAGLYATPIGERGLSMIDVRDIGLAATRELLRRHRADGPLPRVTCPLVGPDVLNGSDLAALWGEALGRDVRYAGDDTASLEQRLRSMGPAWYARNLALMMRRYQSDGMIATTDEIAATTQVLGRTPRAYRAFAEETAAGWHKA